MVLYSDLKSQVLQRLNLEHSNFVADDEFLASLNSSAAELHSHLVRAQQDYWVTETFFNVASGSNTFALPADHYKTLGVDVHIADGYHSLERWIYEERDRYQSNIATSACTSFVRYRRMGANIVLYPATAAGGYAYRLWYVPKLTAATSLSDSLDANLTMENWHEYIIVDCCIKVQAKQESDVDVYVMQKQQLLDRIIKDAAENDQGKPNRLGQSPHSVWNDYDGFPTARW